MRKFSAAVLAVTIIIGLSSCGRKMNILKPTSTNNISTIKASVDIAEEVLISPTEGKIISQTEEENNMYQNPALGIENENIVPHLGIGDPFILRYNGIYYLYHSAAAQCWTSEDLVNWNYEGYYTEDPVILDNPWAPEFTYYNGKFYGIFNPQGEGPYFGVSDSPTGPFTLASKNFDLQFDGSFFIDDNGDMYFSYPQTERIIVAKMDSPVSVAEGTHIHTNCNVAGGWTEGPMIIKHKDTYFMTYCGGEVSNEGYQIHYATSNDPLNWEESNNNPIIINTDESKLVRLGHNSMVVGPNLDSLYIIYHSMESHIGALRQMSIDPLYINGDYMQAFGPTFTSQTVPELPDIYSRFNSPESLEGWTYVNAEIINSELNLSEGGVVISQKGIEGDFTAEYNFLEIEDIYYENSFIPAYGKAGAIFDYTDENNYGAAYINTEGSSLEIVFIVDGKETSYKEVLNASFDDSVNYSVLQTLTVKKSGSTYTFLFNNKTLGSYDSELKNGSIGVSCISGTAKIGFVGIEGNVWHSSYKEYYKPVAGEFGALLCVENDLNTKEYDGKEYLTVESNETYNYYINAESEGNYDFGIKYRSKKDFSFELYLNGNLIYQGSAPASEYDRTEIFRNVKLTQGYGVITFKITEGSADLFNYEFITSTELSETIIFDLNTPLYSEPSWNVENGELKTDSFVKMLYGNREWSDYSVSAEFAPKTDNFWASLLFRVTNESLSPTDSTKEDQYYYLGYSANIVNDEGKSYIALCKQNYGTTELERYDTEFPLNTTIEVTAEVIKDTIKIYLDGNLVIEYSDLDPYMKGAVGFSDVSTVTVNSLKIEPVS